MKNLSKGFLVIVIVLLIVVIVIGGWYLFDLFNKSNDKIKELEEKNVTSNFQNEGIQLNADENKITSDEKFKIYAENMVKNLKKIKENNGMIDAENNIDTEFCGIIEMINDNQNVKLYLSDNEEPITISNNAIDCGVTKISQDNTVLIWVINSKGELLCSEYNKDSMSKEDIKLKMKTGLKNIVSVKSELISNGHSSYGKVVCIDIDGNIFNID